MADTRTHRPGAGGPILDLMVIVVLAILAWFAWTVTRGAVVGLENLPFAERPHIPRPPPIPNAPPLPMRPHLPPAPGPAPK